MTKIVHYDVLDTPARSKHYTTKMPSKTALDAARRTLLGAVNFRGCGQLAQFVGPPSITYSGNGAADFYIVFPTIQPPGNDAKINIGADIRLWDEATDDVDVTWDGGSANTYPVGVTNSQTGSAPPAGLRIFSTNEVAHDLNSVADSNAVYGYTKLEVDNCAIAYVSAYTIPRATDDYRGDSAAASSFDQQFGLKNDAFNIGLPLLGTNDFDSVDGSFGALCQHQNARGDSKASLVSSTAPCVFQYAHPSGVYVAGSGATTWQNLFGTAEINSTTKNTRLRVRGRELDATGSGASEYDKPLDLAVVARWNDSANAKVRVTTYVKDTDTQIDQQTHTFTTGGGDVTTPTLEVDGAFVTYRPSGCDVQIDVAADSSNAVEIQTIALFERSMGDAV